MTRNRLRSPSQPVPKPKPLKRNRYWSAFEKGIFNKYYENEGSRKVKEVLAQKGYYRSMKAIAEYAKARKVYRNPIPDGFISLTHVHPATEADFDYGSSLSARKRAEKDGVLQKVENGGGYAYIVPEEWADTYLAEIVPKIATDRARRGQWLTTMQAAEAFGVSDTFLSHVRRHPEKHQEAASIILSAVIEEGMQRVYWEPHSTRAAARKYKLWRRSNRKARPMLSEPTASEPSVPPARKAA